MRRARLVLGVVAIVLVVAAIAAWMLLDVNRYRDQIQSELRARVGRDVTLGNMSLRIFPLRVQVQTPTIGEDPRFASQAPFIQAENLDVYIGLFALLRGNVRIDSLDLRRPSVELIRNEAGEWNFSSIGRKEQPAPEPAPPTPSEGEKPSFALGRLSIQDGQVALTDRTKSPVRAVYDHIDITVEDFAPDSPFSFDIAAHIPGEGTQRIRLTGTGGPVAADMPYATSFKGELVFEEVGIAGLQAFLSSEALPMAEGSLSGATQIANEAGKLAAKGKLELTAMRVNAVDVGYPIAVDYDVSGDLAEGRFQIASATVKLGPTPLSVSGSIATLPSPGTLDLQLKAGEVSIVEAARLASAFGIAFPPGAKVEGRVSADLHAGGSMANPVLNGTVSGRDLQVSGTDVPQPVRVQAVDLSFTPAEIRSNEFQAVSGATTLNTRFALRNYSSETPVVDAAVRAPEATLPEIQAIAKAYGMNGLDQLTGSGKLSLNLQAAGPVKSMSSTDMIRALNGDLNLAFEPVKIAGFDAARQLAAIAGFGQPAEQSQGDSTTIARLVGRILVKNGVAQTNDLEARLDAGKITATGTADLAAEALNMRVAAVFAKDFSEKAGGTKVGGYLKTVLSNADGELVVPAILTGSFRSPKFSPDTQAVLEMQRKKLLPGLDSPSSAVSSILESLKAPKPAGDAQGTTTEKPKPSIPGILGDLLGGRKQQADPGKQ